MQAKCTFKRITALILSVLMTLLCFPMSALAEEPVIPMEDITVEVITDDNEADSSVPMDSTDPADEEALLTEAAENPDESERSASIPEITIEDEQSLEQTDLETAKPEDPAADSDSPVESEDTPPETDVSDEPVDDRHPLQAAIDTYGHIYVATVRKTVVFSSPVLKADTLVYTTTADVFLLLATAYTNHDTVVVWFLDESGNVVHGFVSVKDLDEKYLLDEDIAEINYLPVREGMTAIGRMGLFIVNGDYPEADTAEEPIPDPIEEIVDEPTVEPDDIELTEFPMEDSIDDETMPEELEQEPQTEETNLETSDNLPEETPAVDLIVPEELPEEHAALDLIFPEELSEDHDPDCAQPGDYVGVTTKTRVFTGIDLNAAETYYSGQYNGNSVKDATVQVLSVEIDENDEPWYQVRYLYGDDFTDGRMKWTNYSTAWILANETTEAASDSCTVTDYAYTLEYLKMTRTSGRKGLRSTTPMNGFTLKNINGQVGGFYAWQSGLYGSSGRDSDYPQIAKSAAHGVIYATPHYLEGFTVFCLEHNLSGPGEGSGSSMTAKGPYVLVDMDTFVNDPSYGGTSGVRFKDSTMHALSWVLRHTYPFMALDRSDSNNEVWSRVAGQFAMREVIKQLEGAQYVRDYWDMDNFYSFSGGAPAVYLEYARWLAANGIARASITGRITASNQSVNISGSNYIGTVTLTTDADLIRIPKSVGTLTGNSGGSDSSYYYVKSGDTIRVTSTSSRFAVSMESLSSDTEEANFLVGVPSVAIQKVLVPIYGAPNILKKGSVSFELSYGEISVTKKSSDGILLKGTVFELLNSAGTVVATATTNNKGIASFANLQPGSYTVREKTPSQGYKLAATSSQNVSVVAGVTATATFTNDRITGRVRIIKKDSVTEKPLAGAVFTVTRLSGPESDNASDIGKVVATITTNAQGIAETGLLPWGEYKIVEAGVPDGYLDSGYYTTIWIK